MRGDARRPATADVPRGRATGTALAAALLTAAMLAGVLANGSARRAGAVARRPADSVETVATAAGPGPVGRIEHVIVIYQENHSFDETLGQFCKDHHNRCDGYVGDVQLSDGVVAPMRKSPDIVPAVFHNVGAQAAAIDGGKMDGWNLVPGCSPPPRNCLTYYVRDQIPNLSELAEKYVVSDRTFSMYDSPSWGGHIYPAAATQDNFTGDLPKATPGVPRLRGWGCDSNMIAAWRDPKTQKMSLEPSCIPARPGKLDAKKFPFNGAFRRSRVSWVPTIFDRMDAKHLSWRLYSSTSVWSICPTFAECRYGPQFSHIVNPTLILNDARSGNLPAYGVLLPEGPHGGTEQHNGSSMHHGDNWIGTVLKSLQASPEWSSTAVFITYDDCGCFYDHVPPGTNPDGSPQGIRMPMVIVSPYTKVGATDHHPASFASILKFTEEAFGLRALSVNDRDAYDYRGSFNFASPPTGPRAVLRDHPVPAASRRYLAAHPPAPDEDDDPT